MSEDKTQWPGQKEAARLINANVRTLQRLDSSGRVRSATIDGRKRYDPVSLQAYLDESNGAEPMVLVAKQLADMVKTLGDQQKDLIGLVMKPTIELHDILCKQNQRQQERISQLEDKHVRTLQVFEELMSMKHEREIDVKRAESNIELKREALKNLMPKLDVLLNSAKTHKPLMQLIGTLTPEQVEAFVDAEVMSTEQAEYIKKIQARTTNGVSAQDSGKENANENG